MSLFPREFRVSTVAKIRGCFKILGRFPKNIQTVQWEMRHFLGGKQQILKLLIL